MDGLGAELQQWLGAILAVAVAIVVALGVHAVFFSLAARAASTRHVFDDALVRHGRGPARLMLPIFALRLAAPQIDLPSPVADVAAHVLSLALIASVAWMIVRFTRVLDDVVAYRFRVDVADNLLARRVRTQTAVVARVVYRILQGTRLWDGKVWNLQVTDATERTMTLRALMSAADAGTAWDLRCHVRERLIDWLQRRHPQALPRTRAEVDARTPPPERRGNGRDAETPGRDLARDPS